MRKGQHPCRYGTGSRVPCHDVCMQLQRCTLRLSLLHRCTWKSAYLLVSLKGPAHGANDRIDTSLSGMGMTCKSSSPLVEEGDRTPSRVVGCQVLQGRDDSQGTDVTLRPAGVSCTSNERQL